MGTKKLTTAIAATEINRHSALGMARSSRTRHNLVREQRLAEYLMANGNITETDLSIARDAQRGLDRPLSDIMVDRSLVTEDEMRHAFAQIHHLALVDDIKAPTSDLADALSAENAIALDCAPLLRSSGRIVIGVTNPVRIPKIRKALRNRTRPAFCLASREQITAATVAVYGIRMAREAEARAPQRTASRFFRAATIQRWGLATFAILATLLILAPRESLVTIFAIALIFFCLNLGLKALALAACLWGGSAKHLDIIQSESIPSTRPIVTILVALYKERSVAGTLVANLSKLEYPRERLDVILVTEVDDWTTRSTLAKATLPPWVRIVCVPPGTPRTKPRALNFALNFARGSIVGVYDAEDRPEPDQINRVVERFARAPSQLACVQGRLDYYNARHNGMSRCFAIEYATWFRVLLPGIQKSGLFVPLGGTTLFLKRKVLERLGAWDAHNVTEDADLGIRLAIHGYHTEILDTTTFEEANAAIWPWIKQRSRWQKGYLMTWAAAMRRPRRLLKSLGPLRFTGFQVQLAGAVFGNLCAPVIWSLLVLLLGMPHPVEPAMSPKALSAILALMLFGLSLSLALSFLATSPAHLRGLRPYAPLVEVYYALGTFAAWYAVFELATKPFHWSKTDHGQFGAVTPPEACADQA